MRWADARGDSFGLSVLAQQRPHAEYIVFCGVHFMAESADILTADDQIVVLPDLNAGCSMADMADIDGVEEAWASIAEVTDIEAVLPITYMNSAADLKAFVGRHGGAVCTSSNARAVLDWALRDPDGPHAQQVLFFPDQHLGRNTGIAMGFTESDMRVWNPRRDLGGLDETDVKDCQVPVVERSLLGAPTIPAASHRGVPSGAPRWDRPGTPRVQPRGLLDRGPGRLDGRDHPRGAGCAHRCGDRRRHRDPPRQPTRRGDRRQDSRVTRSTRVPVFHDVPNRRATSCMDPRGAGRRSRRRTGSRWIRDTAADARLALDRMLQIT